jgi:hypothetical protein
MDLILNELSLYHKANSKFEAQNLMKNLILTCKKANNYDFRKLRVNMDFVRLCLYENYTINDWINDPQVRPDYKTLLLGLKRYPFIAEGDENIETRFVENYYYLDMPTVPELHVQEVEGLAVAFLYNTLSISFETHQAWKKMGINLLEKTAEAQNVVCVKHISCPGNIDFHREWIEANRPVELVKTDIPPSDKKINLRDDHGKDILKKLADKLVKSPYVIKVVNSIPFNPKNKHFIKDIYPDGKVEIILTWTDEGFGLLVQTTGRNRQETKKIADILEKIV